MKKLKTAPQFLEHYVECGFDWKLGQHILKAMRSYAKYQVERKYEELRAEAIENVEFQYGVKLNK